MSQHDFTTAFERSLRDGAARARIPLSADQIRQASTYAQQLVLWNARAGLTTIEEPDAVARRHFLESFILADLLPDQHLRGLDIGSGGGFPGLALKIVRPHLAMTLLEPRQAKAAFLRQVGRVIPALHSEVKECRLEALPAPDAWDFASFRGVRVPSKDIQRVVRPGGLLLGYSGEALQDIVPGLLALGAVLAQTRPIPGRNGLVEAWQLPS